MKKLLSNRYILAVVGIAVTALLFWAARYCVQRIAFHGDYGAQPPAAVYQEAMGQPVPDGVTDLRVSGRKYATRAWVWMRFRATEGALKKLVTDDDKYTTQNVDAVLGGTLWVGNPRYNVRDLQAVGWEDVRRIRSPVIFTIHGSTTDPDTIWFGNMILDPDTHFVYVEMMCG